MGPGVASLPRVWNNWFKNLGFCNFLAKKKGIFILNRFAFLQQGISWHNRPQCHFSSFGCVNKHLILGVGVIYLALIGYMVIYMVSTLELTIFERVKYLKLQVEIFLMYLHLLYISSCFKFLKWQWMLWLK